METLASIEYPLSFTDIKNIYPRAKLIKYSDISKYDNIDDLIGPTGQAIILYLFTPTSGHYVALFKRAGRISYFDSYGFPPEEAYKFMDAKARIENNQVEPYLFQLLEGVHSEYNPYPFQDFKEGIATCGKHCIMRLINSGYSPYGYKLELDKIKKIFPEKSYDEVINDAFAIKFT